MQVSSPGRSTPARDGLKEGEGNVFFTQNSPPPPAPLSKNAKPRDLLFLRPQATFGFILLPFLHFCSLSTSKCTFPWLFGSPLMCFSALVAHFLQNSWSNSYVNPWLFAWIGGVVGDGCRPILYSEMHGHVALPPCLIFSCPTMRPPSVRWNASMTFAHDFVKLSLWNKLCTYGCHCECVGSFVEAILKCQKHDLRLGI